jgi:hypothetical protein
VQAFSPGFRGQAARDAALVPVRYHDERALRVVVASWPEEIADSGSVAINIIDLEFRRRF